MVDLSDAQLDTAEERGRKLLATEPRASAVHFDRLNGRFVVDLVNGCSYAFPAYLVQDLQGAHADDLAQVEVDGLGFNLHWPSLDVDLFVPALLRGVFGTRDWMSREGGSSAGPQTSPAKVTAARPNSAKGGRARKVARS